MGKKTRIPFYTIIYKSLESYASKKCYFSLRFYKISIQLGIEPVKFDKRIGRFSEFPVLVLKVHHFGNI